MKTKASKIIVLALVLLVPFFLGGCKKKCPKPVDNVPGTSTFRPDCPFEALDATKLGTRTLDLYVVYDDTDAFREQVQAFQSRNPGIAVRVKKFDDLADYETTVINEIAEGEGPDVFMVQNRWIPEHLKKLLPMPADLPQVMTPDVFRQTFFQAAADDLIVDNQIYGMPMSMDNLAVYYNKAIFRDQLATTDQPGALWEDIKEQSFQLTKRNNSPERFALAGIALGRADNISSAVDIFYTLMLQYGVKWYDEAGERAIFADSQGTGAVPNPGAAALSLYTSFALPAFKHYSWNDTITGFAPADKEVGPFVRGKVAMIIGYPYLYNAIAQGIQDQQKLGQPHMDEKDIGIAPLPQLTSSQETPRRDTLASYFPLAVARTSDMPKEAWSLVQYLTTAEALQTYHKVTHRPTSRKDMVTQQQTEPLFGVFAYQAPFAKSVAVFDAEGYMQAFSDAITSVVRNLMTPDDALKAAQVRVTCLVRRAKGLVGAETDCSK